MPAATNTPINNATLPQQTEVKPLGAYRPPAIAKFDPMVKVLSVAVFATALAFAWTGWHLLNASSLNSAISLVVAAVLLGICFVTWVLAARAVFYSRQATQRDAERIATIAQLRCERDLMRMIINQLPEHIYVKDLEGRFVFNNASHAQALKKESHELAGKSYFDLFPREKAKQLYAEEQRFLDSEEALLNREQMQERPDLGGQTRWCAASKHLWRDPDGEILGTVGITRDIHDHKVAEAELRQYRRKQN